MGLLTDDMGNPRWRIGGLALLGALSLLLLPPLLRNKEISHPRSSEQGIDLCALLPEPPAPLLGATRRRGTGGSTLCEFSGGAADAAMTVGMVTTREASAAGPQRTSAIYGTWLKEVVADGVADVREQPGDWAKASSYRDTRRNHVLIEDHGVLLMLNSTGLDAAALLAYARTATAALRKP